MFLGNPHIRTLTINSKLLISENYNKKNITISILHHPSEEFNESELNAYGGRPPAYLHLAQRCHIILSGHTHSERLFPPSRPVENYALLFKIGATYQEDEKGYYHNNCEILKVNTDERFVNRLKLYFEPSELKWIDELDSDGTYTLINSNIKRAWEDFQKKIDHNLKPMISWVMKLLISQKDYTIYFSIIKELLEVQLSIEIKPALIKSELKKIKESPSTSHFQDLMNNIDDTAENFIEKEGLFKKLLEIVDLLKREYNEDPIRFNELILDYLSILDDKEKENLKISFKDEEIQDTDWKSSLEFLYNSIKKPLWKYKAQNFNNIEEFSSKELLQYCTQQIELADLASQYGYRYNEEFFVPDEKLESFFEEFSENLENSYSRERIFLLLGHMGLGKTWNASYLALKYVKSIPTFFFQLGSSYETEFYNLFGGLEDKVPKLKELIKNKVEKKPRNILIIFDAFDELSDIERDEFISNICEILKDKNISQHLMILLTSRLVDWVNTSGVKSNSRRYKEFIFQNINCNEFEGKIIRTGASFILSDIQDYERLQKLSEKYGLDLERVKDRRVIELLKKPFILNIISRTNKDIITKNFKPKNEAWFEIFAGRDRKDTILKRMGIFDEYEETFKDLVCEIADPYWAIPEEELRDFIEKNKRNWSIIHSSGIIERRELGYQFEYIFKEEYQGFIEYYIGKLKAHFHDNWICKADVNILKKIEKEIEKQLNDISEFEYKQTTAGYVINKFGRVSELHLWKSSLKFIPSGVSKLIGLEKLNLRNNSIIKIPENLGKLINLKELNLSENQIINIPKALINLKILERLNLMKNQIRSIDSWWREFKSLKFINTSENKHKIGHPDKDLPSIDFVAKNIDLIDDDLIYFLEIKKDNEHLKIKDAVIIDYLNHLRKNSNNKFSFSYSSENYFLKSLTLTGSPELKELFWSVEKLQTLRLMKNQTKFKENFTIKNLEIIDISKPDENLELKLIESINLLRKLEILNIKGFTSISLPSTLKKCVNLRHFYIFSKKLKDFPLLILELENIHNIIINSPLEENEFDKLIKITDNELNLGLIRFATNINLPDLNIKSHIRTFFLTHVNMLPNKIVIESNITKLIIIQNARFPYRFLEDNPLNKDLGDGFFFLNCKTFTLPLIVNDFKYLTHLRIDNNNLTNLPEWVLKSPHIEKLIITSENLQTPLKEFINERNKGTFEIRTYIDYNLSDINVDLKNLTHLRINMPNLQILPKFIDTLTQMKQILITSTELNDLTSKFGEKENKYRLEIRTRHNLILKNSFENLKEITHLQINKINLKGDFNIFSSLTNLTHLRIVHGTPMEIPSCIESLPLIKQLHLYSQGENPLRSNFWSNQDKGRFEFQISKNSFTLQHLRNISHLRISGHNNINATDGDYENLKYLRIENCNQIPSYIQKMSNLKFIELDVNNVRIFPDYIALFSDIKKLVITTKKIEFSNDFWRNNLYPCLKIRVIQDFKNFEFISYFKNLSHLWIEIPELKDFPKLLEKFLETIKSLKIYKGKEIDGTINDYLENPNPVLIIIRVSSECSIPDNLKQYIV